MKEQKMRVTTWYLEPLDPDTNRVCANNLPDENACTDKLCADGKRHDLWVCTHFYVQRVVGAKEQLKLRFRVYVQEGSRGKIRPWKFGNRPKSKAKLAA